MAMTNLERAIIARVTLDAFIAQTDDDGIESTITDLVADLGHLCDLKKLNFQTLVARAVNHWEVERTEAGGNNPRRMKAVGVVS